MFKINKSNSFMKSLVALNTPPVHLDAAADGRAVSARD
jgi:hypothetical protein